METLTQIAIVGTLVMGLVQLVALIKLFQYIGKLQGKNLDLGKTIELLRHDVNRVDTAVREEIGRHREETGRVLKENREEITTLFKNLSQATSQAMTDISLVQEQKFNSLIARQTEMNQVTEIKLTQIGQTVDQKLQESVEKRFNESFKLISERLDQVHKGLGEMQTLASGVGDLKRVLTNVKTRGVMGEIQLGAILEQVLSPEQYERNAATKPNTLERVEFAIRLPGKDKGEQALLLPIDSKFPIEDYQRILDLYERQAEFTPSELEASSKQLELAVKKAAKDIKDKYLNPPYTTDFGIMFVPTEGLYAEILRRNGLFETLQRDYKITVVGPTNLVAFLSSLQMGFKTLAIERRSSEVWELLGAVKSEFGHFGDILDKTKKKLEEAANVIDKAGVRSRAIQRRLKDVEVLETDYIDLSID